MLLDALFRGKPGTLSRAGFAICVACGAEGREGLCKGCFRDLPWNDHACTRCAAPLPLLPSRVCGDCARRPPPFEAAYAAFRYAWPADRLLQQFKFHDHLATGRILSLALSRYLALRDAPAPDLMVPVPLHRARLAARGFNQAGEIARSLAPLLHTPLRRRALRRTRPTPSQRGLDRRARGSNLRGAFACPDALTGLHVAVVDDVITTGSTAAEIARTLHRAGAARVDVYALARA